MILFHILHSFLMSALLASKIFWFMESLGLLSSSLSLSWSSSTLVSRKQSVEIKRPSRGGNSSSESSETQHGLLSSFSSTSGSDEEEKQTDLSELSLTIRPDMKPYKRTATRFTKDNH